MSSESRIWLKPTIANTPYDFDELASWPYYCRIDKYISYNGCLANNKKDCNTFILGYNTILGLKEYVELLLKFISNDLLLRDGEYSQEELKKIKNEEHSCKKVLKDLEWLDTFPKDGVYSYYRG